MQRVYAIIHGDCKTRDGFERVSARPMKRHLCEKPFICGDHWRPFFLVFGSRFRLSFRLSQRACSAVRDELIQVCRAPRRRLQECLTSVSLSRDRA